MVEHVLLYYFIYIYAPPAPQRGRGFIALLLGLHNSIMQVGFKDHAVVLSEIGIKNILPKSTDWHFNSSFALDNGFRDVLLVC